MSEHPTLPFGEPVPPERWLPVPGYEGLYEVSDQGRVWSNQWRTSGKRGGLLKPTRISAGNPHLKVALYLDGVTSAAQIAHLVAAAFIGPRPEGQVVRHGPGGPADNRLVNLCYGTHAENMQDKKRDGTMPYGVRNPLAVLTVAIVRECRLRCAQGERQEDLAREFRVSQRTIWLAVTGRTWADVDTPPVAAAADRKKDHGQTKGQRRAKLTPQLVREIRERHAGGELMQSLAGEFGTANATISLLVNRKTWKHVA